MSKISNCCEVCGAMKKDKSITVHTDEINNSFILAKMEITGLSRSEVIDGFITEKRLESDRQFQIMRKVHELTENQ